jgi:flagellum-specific peptidoglycan hydrolase FlgJ
MAVMIESKNAHLEPAKKSALAAAIAAAEEANKEVAGAPAALMPVTVAQFLLESNWGAAAMGTAHNYFGIKARDGEPFVEKETWEHVGGKDVKVVAKFRAYSSMAECFADHAKLICNRTSNGQKIYRNALAHGNDPIAFAHALTGVYATDPGYGDKLVNIMESRGLLESFGFVSAT